MSLKLSDLPDINFVNADKETVTAQIINLYESTTGRTLGAGDPVRLFLLVIANVVILLLNKINYTGKQNLLAYANGTKLDHVAAMIGTARQEASKATLTETFTLSSTQASGTVIPAGTRVSAGDDTYFALDEDLTIAAGNLTGTGSCTALTAGASGNGYLVGKVTTLVDPLPYVASVTNMTASSGGADAEADDHYRERAHNFAESYSTAGPEGAYEYWAKAANTAIESVLVVVPGDTAPGEVWIYPMLTGGIIPDEEIRKAVANQLNARKRRPLTDKVSIKTPTEVDYNVNLTYYIEADEAENAANINVAVTKAVEEFKTWERSKLGRDINPSVLIAKVIAAGAKRVEVTSPVFTHVKNGSEADGFDVELARCASVEIKVGGAEDE